MDHRRFITFLVCFFAFTYVYNAFIIPKYFPRAVAPATVMSEAGNEDSQPPETDSTDSDSDSGDEASEDNTPEIHPATKLSLGSQNLVDGFFLQVDLNSKGAAIDSVHLSDPKFKELKDRSQQVKVLGNNATEDRTFSTAVSTIDDQLKKHGSSLETVDWKVVSSDSTQATFEYTAPNKSLRVRKTYGITSADVSGDVQKELRTNAAAFTIELELTVTNLSDKSQEVVYELQGPVGIVLENAEHTRKYRDIKFEFLGEDDSDVTLGAKAVGKLYAKHQGADARQTQQTVKQKESWTGAFRYAGVDVQFFAALVAPLDSRTEEQRLTKKWIDRSYPMMIEEDVKDVNRSDISFRMQSTAQTLQPNGQDDSVTHKYGFFVGPKRSTLLDPAPLEAEAVLDYGSWFGFIARIMHWLLDTIYSLGLPYFLAIIGLTVLVRGCMFPLSRKQAISAARMKELQPKINELKLKYGDEKEKFAKAQMELWRKNNINPLGGCMPVFFQLPVFIALYSCLNTAVDLRLSRFLWIDNLAAPDALFQMPMSLPILGSEFNLLPCITVVLFLVQQKLFMPPPADEQAEMQQKMMNFMTIAMGFMFWHVPAGLCIYFIASSAWGIAERKLLGSKAIAVTPNVVDVTDADSSKGKKTVPAKQLESDEPRKEGFIARQVKKVEQAVKAAEEAQKQAGQTANKSKGNQKKANQKKGKNKKGRK